MPRTILRAALAALSVVSLARAAQASQFSLLYSFGAYSGDAATPAAALVPHGAFYSVTRNGGTSPASVGAVYTFNPVTGAEATIHSFNITDGFDPFATPVIYGGAMFGTTVSGGLGVGLVFALDIATGAEKILHQFTGHGDGADPNGVIRVGRYLYGTTSSGGTFGKGTVYRLDLSGNLTTLHSFGATAQDGTSPYAALLYDNGMLYGTTFEGGAGSSSFGDGTVFSIDPASGIEKIIYSFTGSADANSPQAPLIALNGILYGTASGGGAYGEGAAYAVDPLSGTETILHSFGHGEDGAYPQAPLLFFGGKLFGTTELGGANGVSFGGLGTVFELDPITNAEIVLHSFSGTADGNYPLAGLTYAGKMLYGTASEGGTFNDGSIFSLRP